MNAKLQIEDARNIALDLQSPRQRLLYEFFEFWPNPRDFSNSSILQHCNLFNIYINYYVSSWVPDVRPPTHPGVFADFFPDILSRLTQTHSITLLVKSTDQEYFNEAEIIRTLLKPQQLKYMLLPDYSKIDNVVDRMGYLFFEWPVGALASVVKEWFMSPQITIEGYVSPESPFSAISSIFFQPDNEHRIAELLRNIDFGFKLWPDNNGLFLISDKLNRGRLEERLELKDLNRSIQEAVLKYEKTNYTDR